MKKFVIAICLLLVCDCKCFAISTTKVQKFEVEMKHEDSKVPLSSKVCPALNLSKSDHALSWSNSKTESFCLETSAQVKALNCAKTLDSTTDVGGTITSEVKLISGNTYHAGSDINILSGGTLIIEPNAVLRMAWGTRIYVHGGTLVSRGSPANYACIIPEEYPQYYWEYTWQGLLIDDANSCNSEVSFTYISCAYNGIEELNVECTKEYSNNFIESCAYGITSYGPNHTKIRNNIFYWCGYQDEEGYLYGGGIDSYHASHEEVEDDNSVIDISENLCIGNVVGIMTHGFTKNTEIAGLTFVKNNSSCGSVYWNYAYTDGSQILECLCNGGWVDPYWFNQYEINSENVYGPVGFVDYGAVLATDNPYVEGPGYFDVGFLSPSSLFVNAGAESIADTQYAGTTTRLDGLPDSNFIDIGYHYSNWGFSNANASNLSADLNNDLVVDVRDLTIFAESWLFDANQACDVWFVDLNNDGEIDFKDIQIFAEDWLDPYDFQDFAKIASQWQKTYDYNLLFNLSTDLDGNKKVDFQDFALFASQWGQTGSADPNISITIDGDGSTGYVDVTLAGFNPDTKQVLLFVDGAYKDVTWTSLPPMPISINVAELSNGAHQFKAVAVSDEGKITCSHITEKSFSCPFSYALISTGNVNRELPFRASSNITSETKVQALDRADNVLWEKTYAVSDGISDCVPEPNACKVVSVKFDNGGSGVDQQLKTQMSAAGASSGGAVSVATSWSWKKWWLGPNVEALVVLPLHNINVSNSGPIIACEKAFDNRGIKYVELTGSSATAENLRWYNQNYPDLIHYLYVASHGGYADGDVRRTLIQLYGEVVPSIVRSDYVNTSEIPYWMTPLPTYEKSHTWFWIGFQKIWFANFDNCYTQRNLVTDHGIVEAPKSCGAGAGLSVQSDLSWVLGMSGYVHGGFFTGQYCMGWWGTCTKSNIGWWNKWSRTFWTHFGNYETLLQSIDAAKEACKNPTGSDTDPYGFRPNDTYYITGAGEDIYDFKLER